jgi:phosphotriesterase-related protein
MGKTLIHEHFIFGYPVFQGDATLGAFNEEKALEDAINAARLIYMRISFPCSRKKG